MKDKKQTLKQIMAGFDKNELVNILSALIKIPSHKKVEWQENKLALYIYDLLLENDINEVKLDYIAENRPNIKAKIKGNGEGLSLMLNAHLDTIPPYNMIIPPYEPIIKNGFIQGRGVVDMKGSMAAMLLAMILIKRSGINLAGELSFTGVIDQEQRSLGAVKLVEDNFNADYAIVGEATDLTICHAHKGMEWMKIIVKGKSAHGSTPEKGANPIYQACRIAEEIDKFNQDLREKDNKLLGYPTINVGVIHGGNDPNIVPNVAYLEIDRRYTPDEKLEDIYEEIQRIITRLNTINPDFEVELIPMDDRVCPLKNIPLLMDTDNNLVFSLLDNIKKFTDRDGKTSAFKGWSDAALFANKLGITSVVFGPGLPQDAHVVDERLKIDDLIDAARIYLATIIDICY